jgi:rSAM/selenodomain-associated transferase 2
VRLSVIIPTWNEAGYLADAVARVRRCAVLGEPEIIVADCDSPDGTAEVAAKLGLRVVRRSPRLDSRAAALNHGAAHASGDVLMFLDADTMVPPRFDAAIAAALRDPRSVGGAFEFSLDRKSFALRWVEIINRVRYRIWPRFYGDQGVFVRADVFRRAGGYPPWRIMEASEFTRRLARHGRVRLLHRPIVTSARRFTEGGVWRVLGHDIRLWWLDLLGYPVQDYAARYWQNNQKRATATA